LPDRASAVYDMLLGLLNLSEYDNENLLSRGFSEKQIEDIGFKTLPTAGRSNIVLKLASKFDNNLEGIAGFYYSEKQWKLAGASGLLIPVRSIDGDITNLKVRSTNENFTKYTQISSDPKVDKKTKEQKYPQGTKAKVAVHHPFGERTKTIRITEGEFKAEIATMMTEQYTIGVAGVGLWRYVLPTLKQLKPDNIFLAYDSDKSKMHSTSVPDGKPYEVGIQLSKLYLALKDLQYNVIIEDWNEKAGKGIDDVLNNGAEDQIKYLTEEEAEEFVETSLADDMVFGWVYVIGVKRFFNAESFTEWDKEQFSDENATKMKKGGRFADKMLREDGFPKAHKLGYEPKKARLIEQGKETIFNLWKDPQTDPVDADATPFLDHCKYIIPDDNEREVFLDFMAFNLQKQGEKILWAVLLQGMQGTGKSYFAEIMTMILGEHNVSSPSNEELHEVYTQWAKNCSFVVVEELMARGRLDLMNKLKPMITQPRISIREMYTPNYEMPNRFNMLLLTNHKDAIILDEDDRRYFVVHSDAKIQKEKYYDELWDWTRKPEGIGAIYHNLLQRDLSQFNPKSHAPMTKAKQEIIRGSLTDLQAWITEGVENEVWPFHTDLICPKHIVEAISSSDNLRHLGRVSTQLLGRTLEKMKFPAIGQVTLSDNSRVQLRCIRKNDMWKSASQRARVSHYEKHIDDGEPINTVIEQEKR
jgi:hypothetical protein